MMAGRMLYQWIMSVQFQLARQSVCRPRKSVVVMSVGWLSLSAGTQVSQDENSEVQQASRLSTIRQHEIAAE